MCVQDRYDGYRRYILLVAHVQSNKGVGSKGRGGGGLGKVVVVVVGWRQSSQTTTSPKPCNVLVVYVSTRNGNSVEEGATGRCEVL